MFESNFSQRTQPSFLKCSSLVFLKRTSLTYLKGSSLTSGKCTFQHLEFNGVMRFYYQSQDSTNGQKVATKCIRVTSSATTKEIIETLIEKFRPDMRMLEVPEYAMSLENEDSDLTRNRSWSRLELCCLIIIDLKLKTCSIGFVSSMSIFQILSFTPNIVPH